MERKNGTKKERKQMNRKSVGFTLVELIVVLVILSILAAVAVPAVTGFIDDGKAKECQTQMEALAADIATAKMSYEVGDETGDAFDISTYIASAGELGKCPSGGEYSVDTTDASQMVLTCSLHGKAAIPNSGKFSVTVAAPIPETPSPAPETPTPTPDNTGKNPDSSPKPDHTYRAKIGPGPLDLEVGGDPGNLTVTVTEIDENGNAVPVDQSRITVEWIYPEDGSVRGPENGVNASVTAEHEGSGQIKCKVTITETDGSTTTVTSDSVDFTVSEPKPNLHLNVPSKFEVEKDRSAKIEVGVYDEENEPYIGGGVTVMYESENPDVVEVDPVTGEVRGNVPEGECNVTVTLKDEAGNVLDEKKVTVKVKPEEEPQSQPRVALEVTPGSIDDLKEGESKELTASVTEEGLDGKGNVNYQYEWKTSDPNIKVTPSADGKTATVTGVSAGETPSTVTCTVTVTYTDGEGTHTLTETKTIPVTVTETEPELGLVVPPVTVKEGEEGKLEPSGTGGSGNYEYKFENLTPDIIEVDENTGKVTGGKAGGGQGKVRVTVTDTVTGKTKSVDAEINVTEGGLFDPHTFQIWTTDAASVELQKDEVFKRNLDKLPPGTWSLVSGDIGQPSFFSREAVKLFPKHYENQTCATDFVLKYVTDDGREDVITVKIGYPIEKFTQIYILNNNASEVILTTTPDPLYTSDVPFTWEVEPESDSAMIEWNYVDERHMQIEVKKSIDGQCKFKVRVRTIRQKTGEEVLFGWNSFVIDKKNAITNVTLSPSPLTLKVGQTATLTATPECDSNAEMSRIKYCFSSESGEVANVEKPWQQQSENMTTVTALKAGNTKIKVDVFYGDDWMASAQCDVTVAVEETETETETRTEAEGEVLIDGQRFKATSWEKFKKAVENDPNYTNNKGWGENNPDERDSPIYYDEVKDENGIIRRNYYVALGTGLDYNVKNNPERRSNVQNSSSFQDFMTKPDSKILFAEISEESIKNAPSFREEDARNNNEQLYEPGTIVKIIRTGTNKEEYYILNQTSDRLRGLSTIFEEKKNNGWWRLDILP